MLHSLSRNCLRTSQRRLLCIYCVFTVYLPRIYYVLPAVPEHRGGAPAEWSSLLFYLLHVHVRVLSYSLSLSFSRSLLLKHPRLERSLRRRNRVVTPLLSSAKNGTKIGDFTFAGIPGLDLTYVEFLVVHLVSNLQRPPPRKVLVTLR